MKPTLTVKLIATLLLTVASVTQAQTARDVHGAQSKPQQLTLTFELQDLPGRNEADSFWEVSYQWWIADQRDFDRWSREGEDLTKQGDLGRLLSKQSFTRRNLAAPANRHFTVAVSVDNDLLGRLQNAQLRAQIVWLDATVRVHDSKLGADVVKRITPVWGPDFYRTCAASLRMEVNNHGSIRWYIGDTAPWEQKPPYALSTANLP